MYSKIDKGTCVNIQGLDCWLPPVGYVYNILTGSLERRPVIQRSTIKEDQYWERTPPPDWYASKLSQEEKMQLSDPEYVDNDLEKYRGQEWDRRLNGCWVMINGKAHYLTGLHYFYLQWWSIDIGYPKFRIPDLEYFYFLQYVQEDPECLGMIEVTKRRFGKSYRSGVFSFERISKRSNSDGGIQSKTSTDAKKLFGRSVIAPFKKLPKFFRPEYDLSGGITPKTEIRFQQTNIKGKKAESVLDKEELNSGIDWQSSEAVSYDGRKLIAYVGDEVGKTIEVNVYDRHQVVMYCVLDDEGKVIGKMLYTTTVEDMESGGGNFKLLWEDSDQLSKGEYDRTPSGLYRFFMPAHRTRNFNKYGYPDEEKTLNQILKERKSLENSPRALSARIRKEPLTVEEAFRVDGDKCLYDSVKLNDRLDVLSWGDQILERGNFEWVGGVRDSKVAWTKSPNGRWWMPKSFSFESESDTNKIHKIGNLYYPANKRVFVSGLDPYDHDQTEDDNKRSMAASLVLKRNNPMEGGLFNRAFVCLYFARPDFAAIMYEDMIKQCVFFGCGLLFESNKPGVKKYFETRGYGPFLIHLPGYKEPGIPSTPENKRTLAEQTEEYISNNIDKVYFDKLIKQWLEFRLDKTQKYDIAMAAGWTLVADMEMVAVKTEEPVSEVSEIFETFN